MKHYILDANGEPQETDDLMTWARWFEGSGIQRTVVLTNVTDNVCVSTVFLGSDHNFFDDGPPLLFETMVFGGKLDQHCERYTTREQAIAGHDQIVAQVREQVTA